MEEENDKVKLVAGVVAVVVVLGLIGFFVLKGFFAKKPQQTAEVHSNTVSPAPSEQATVSPVPSQIPSTAKTAGSSGTPVYYYQSQSSSNSQGDQSQSQSSTNQTQTQTLPNGMTQTQSQ